MDADVCLQRIAGAPARVRTPAALLVKRPKQKLRELVRRNRNGSLPPEGLSPLGDPRVRRILEEESREVRRLECDMVPAFDRNGLRRRRPKTGFSERYACVPSTSAGVKE